MLDSVFYYDKKLINFKKNFKKKDVDIHLDILDIHVFRQLDIHTAIWIYIFNLDIDNTT